MSRSRHNDEAQPTIEACRSAESVKEPDSHPCCEQVRELAYFKWQQSGCPECDGTEFWLAAEAEIQAPAAASEEVAEN